MELVARWRRRTNNGHTIALDWDIVYAHKCRFGVLAMFSSWAMRIWHLRLLIEFRFSGWNEMKPCMVSLFPVQQWTLAWCSLLSAIIPGLKLFYFTILRISLSWSCSSLCHTDYTKISMSGSSSSQCHTSRPTQIGDTRQRLALQAAVCVHDDAVVAFVFTTFAFMKIPFENHWWWVDEQLSMLDGRTPPPFCTTFYL